MTLACELFSSAHLDALCNHGAERTSRAPLQLLLSYCLYLCIDSSLLFSLCGSIVFLSILIITVFISPFFFLSLLSLCCLLSPAFSHSHKQCTRQTCVFMFVHTHIHVYPHTLTDTHMLTLILMHTLAHTHTHTHTNTRARGREIERERERESSRVMFFSVLGVWRASALGVKQY